MSVEALKKTYLFRDFYDTELSDLVAVAQTVTVQPGDRLIEAGKKNEALWILIKGGLVVRDALPGGLEVDLFRLKGGELFGEMSYVDHLPASATVMAETSSTILKISFAAFDGFLSKSPQTHVKVLEQLLKIFSERLRAANKQIGKGFLASLGVVD